MFCHNQALHETENLKYEEDLFLCTNQHYVRNGPTARSILFFLERTGSEIVCLIQTETQKTDLDLAVHHRGYAILVPFFLVDDIESNAALYWAQ